MKILFIDPSGYAYDTTTPSKQPLGGTQSAIVYLSVALAQAGHNVAVINGSSQPTVSDGVRFMNLPCPAPVMNQFDVVILASCAMAGVMRDSQCTRPLVLWSQHAADQPPMQSLRSPFERSLYAGFAMVSQWQANEFQRCFDINPAAIGIMRNAVSPGFLNSVPSNRWLKTRSPPVLGYSSTPYRGLDILLLSFPAIRAQVEGTTLRVFSSMGIYNAEASDEFSSLYELARVIPGVTYVGPLPQPRLAEAMAEIDIWAYPCTFAETSCISAMEAMASGALLVTTNLGALPETTAGYARLYALLERSDDSSIPGRLATRYASQLRKTVAEVSAAPQQSALAIIDKQIQFARTHYNWTARAAEWSEWLERIV